MGLGKGLGRTLQRLSDFFYRVPKLLRCSGRLELRLVWRSPAGPRHKALAVDLAWAKMRTPWFAQAVSEN
ncbi:hypothetical protein AAFF_G00077930 [Aldrovandia affinis]|uniref:Uncharacterized protein n=1 Tax=Aldrovandia affinis TaxID=143900 RepID=A0AAD7RXY4_9TELE|nr:hypothetical protein AAFF_G00077930 [Aldrovandia affinis]